MKPYTLKVPRVRRFADEIRGKSSRNAALTRRSSGCADGLACAAESRRARRCSEIPEMEAAYPRSSAKRLATREYRAWIGKHLIRQRIMKDRDQTVPVFRGSIARPAPQGAERISGADPVAVRRSSLGLSSGQTPHRKYDSPNV